MSVVSKIKGVGESEHGTTALMLTLFALLAGNLIPTPADALHFYTQRNLRDAWKKNQITPEAYWTKSVTSYYLYNSLWWAFVILMTWLIPGSTQKKTKVAFGLIGAGAVVGVVFNLYNKDVKALAAETPAKNSVV